MLCDTQWAGKSASSSSDRGGLGLSQSEMLRLDADVLLVQLNIRKLQDVGGVLLPPARLWPAPCPPACLSQGV